MRATRDGALVSFSDTRRRSPSHDHVNIDAGVDRAATEHMTHMPYEDASTAESAGTVTCALPHLRSVRLGIGHRALKASSGRSRKTQLSAARASVIAAPSAMTSAGATPRPMSHFTTGRWITYTP